MNTDISSMPVFQKSGRKLNTLIGKIKLATSAQMNGMFVVVFPGKKKKDLFKLCLHSLQGGFKFISTLHILKLE